VHVIDNIKTVHDGWGRFLLVTMRYGDGSTHPRQLEDHGDAAAVLPYDPERRVVVLVRQPRVARAWFIKYQDRVLFGKDSWNPTEYHTYFRVLETDDDYFDYYRRRHAFWQMYGLDLPDEVLRKLYYKNALRLLPGLDATAFPN
jgi:hypothetical protein